MSWQPCDDPDCPETAPSNVETLIVPRARDLGGFEVRRVLPSSKRKLVGPFIFFDQMGPAEFLTGQGIDVRPHPHIGLATVTYLFSGEILHRDSLGSLQAIRPGELNWMTAGRGIVHSERTAPEIRASGQEMFGMQAWVALPKASEEIAPAFVHHGLDDQPVVEGEGVTARIIAGSFAGKSALVDTASPLFYVDVSMAAGARLTLPAEHEDRAAYVVSGGIELDGQSYQGGQLLVFRPGAPLDLKAEGATRVMLLGGEPLEGPRHIWWNFVSSDPERIEQAKADWRAGRFDAVPGDSEEFIPLPEK